MCTADAPQFQSWRISREDLSHYSCNHHFGRLRRHALHAHIEILTYIFIYISIDLDIDIIFSSAEHRHEHRVCSRQYDSRPASQQWMDRVCALASWLRDLSVMLVRRAADYLVSGSGRKFAIA